MKVMFPQGKCCDLACYPSCPGYLREGCLLFGEKRNFKSMQSYLIANHLFIWQLKGHNPGGMWKENETIVLGKNLNMPVYGDEKQH